MAGAGYKLFNTGDVLTAAQVNTYLMEQTVMVFADAAARTAALSGVVSEGMISYLKDTNAVEVYNGSAWVASDDPNAIQNSIINAKGDLIVGSANDTPSILSVSSDGSTLVADSSASTGLRYNPQNALANPVINGGMDIWQRGTSFIGGVDNLGADRWNTYRSTTGSTFSRQTTSDTTNLPTIQYCMRAQRNSGNTSTVPLFLFQDFETVNSLPFAGKTVTFSFYARKGANYSSANDYLSALLITGTGTDQSQRAGYANQNSIISQNAVLTTSWQRFAFTATVGTTATQLGIQFTYTPSGTAGANDYFEVTGVQVDLGTYTASSAPTFRRSGSTLGQELAACQRYYYRITAAAASRGLAATGWAYSTTAVSIYNAAKSTMRTSPTSVDFANLGLYDNVNAVANATTAAIYTDGTNENNYSLLITGATGLTQYRPYQLVSQTGTTGYIGLSAEL